VNQRKYLVSALLFLALAGAGTAWADKATLKANLSAARERLLKVVRGEGDPKVLIPEIQALTPKIDAEADSVPGFRPIWEKFKNNRDTKIIPAFDGTNPEGQDAAKALATGEQKQLFEQMMGLLQ
jgi:hypothetical protein